MFKKKILLLAALILCSSAFADNKLENLIFQNERMSTRLVENQPRLECRLENQGNDVKKQHAQFDIKDLNANPGDAFDFYFMNSIHDLTKIGEIVVNGNYEFILYFLDQKDHKNLPLNENHFFIANTFLQGEPITCAVVSKDQNVCLATRIVAKPLTAIGSRGQKVDLLLKSRIGSLYLCEGTGFKPHEKLKITSISESEFIENEITANDDGSINLAITPFVKGLKKGRAKISITCENGECLTIPFYWGKKNLKKTLK